MVSMSPADALLVFPLLAAMIFALAALALKRSSQLGVTVWQTALAVNVFNAIAYGMVWFVGGPPIQWELIWQPLLIAACLFLGMATQFIAMDRGDVSVAVPILGMKVLIVAFMSPLLIGEAIPSALWISAVLSVVGVAFLNWKGGIDSTRSLMPAFVAGGIAAVCFALFDILVAKWGRPWGAGRLLPIIFGATALFSLACTLRYPAQMSKLSPAAWRWLVLGASFIGLQSIFFVGCVAVYGGATRANIFYASRGLFSVVFVWVIGHWFSSEERTLGPQVLFFRFVGSVFLLAAIVLAILYS